VYVQPASHDALYYDPGATCTDNVDIQTEINDRVEVMGQAFPQPNALGKYVLNYGCTNQYGRTAPPMRRTVVIEDLICPVCEIRGPQEMSIEASFPFTDPGVACDDTFDGPVQQVVEGTVNIEMTGLYKLTYRACDTTENCNDSPFCPSDQGSTVRTVRVVDTLKPVISMHVLTDGRRLGSRSRKAGLDFQPPILMSSIQPHHAGFAVLLVMTAFAIVTAAFLYTKKDHKSREIPV